MIERVSKAPRFRRRQQIPKRMNIIKWVRGQSVGRWQRRRRRIAREAFLRPLTPLERRCLTLRAQGYNLAEIANVVGGRGVIVRFDRSASPANRRAAAQDDGIRVVAGIISRAVRKLQPSPPSAQDIYRSSTATRRTPPDQE